MKFEKENNKTVNKQKIKRKYTEIPRDLQNK